MENKVIGITAANIVADSGTVSTTGTFSSPLVNVTVPVTEISTAEQSFTDVQANTLDNTLSTSVQAPSSIQAKTADLEINIKLSGYGEESLSNYGSLFLRPSQWLNITNISDLNSKGYGKSALDGISSQELNTKLIGTVTNFIVAASEQLITTNSFFRKFVDGGADAWYYSDNYAVTDTEYVKPLNYLIFADQKTVELIKPFSEVSNSSDINTKLISPKKLEIVTGTESAQKVYEKQVLELLTASDDFYGTANLDDDQYAFIIKVLQDDATLSQRFSSEIFKVRADTAVLVESARKTISQLKLENTLAVDTVVTETQFRPQLSDTIIASDDFLGAASLDDDQYVAMEKVIYNQTILTEQNRKALSKVLNTELIQASELHASLLQKVFSDLVNSTDDFYGAANVDDDQYALVIKGVVETTVTSETQQYLVSFKRTIVDVPVALERTYKALQKVAGVDYLQNVSDSASLHPNKITIQDSFFSERYVREDFAEDDRPISNDAYPVFELLRTKLETATISTSLFKFNNQKVLENIAGIATQYRNALITPKFDSSVITDSKSLLVDKTTLENTSISEEAILDTDKAVLEGIALPEAVVFESYKYLESLVSTTDDFYGEANLDDDQIVTVLKVLHDTVSVIDSLDALYTPSTPVEDSSVLTDEYTASFTKVREDLLTGTDEKTALIEKSTPELVTASEMQIFDASKVLVDAADWFAYDYLDETYTLGGIVLYDQVGKLLETVVTADTLTGVYETDPVFYAYKALESQTDLLEVLSFELSFHLADYLIATDDFYGLANIDDDQVANFNKVLHEVTGATIELATYFVEKSINDSAYSISHEAAKDINKVLLDLVSTSDDFYGLANLDDDQVAHVGKVLNTSLLGVGDLANFVTDTYRTFLETSTLGQEVQIFEVYKDFGYTQAVVVEQQAFDNLKITQDAFTPVEESTKDIAKVLIDDNVYVAVGYSESIYAVIGPAILDQIQLDIQPSVLEVIGLSETYLDFVSELTKLDVPLVTEIASKELDFNLLDNFNTTDDFYGLANFDDDQTVLFAKVVNDLVFPAQELVVFEAEKALEEIVPAQDIISSSLETVYSDNYYTQEQAKLDYIKVLETALVATEELLFLLVQGRWFDDAYTASELATVDYEKVADYELTTLTETDFTKLLEKSVLHTVIAGTELFVTDINSVLEDKPEWFSYDYTSESYTLGGAVTYDELSYALETVLQTEFTALYTNAPVFVSEKTLLTTGTASDSFARVVNYNTSYTDTISPTDDFLGAANLDDDQYVLFVKAVVEYINTTEVKNFEVLKNATDTSSILSEVSLDAEKPVEDTSNAIDEKVMLALKAINNSIVSSEVLTFLLIQGRWFTDTAAISQEFKLGLNQAKLEQTTTQDLRIVVYDKFKPELVTYNQELSQNYGMLNPGPDFFLEVYSAGYTKGGVATAEYAYKLFDKPIATPETVTLADTRSHLLQKYKPEQTTVTQTLFTLTVQKQKPEVVAVAEIMQRVIAKAKTEAVVSSEAATALIENYFPPQFAQVGYVGTNFTL